MFSAFRGAVAALVLASLAACGGGGGGSEPPPAAPNHAPHASVLASGDVHADGADIVATVGGVAQLDGGTSTDDDHDALSYEWTLLIKPAGSVATLASGSTQRIEIRPDMLGDYTVALKVTDSKGASSTQQVVLKVNNRAPVSSVVVATQFTAVPATPPTQAVTVGANVLLDASASTDPDGDAVNVGFELIEKPAGSAAALTLAAKTARLSPDLLGLYKARRQFHLDLQLRREQPCSEPGRGHVGDRGHGRRWPERDHDLGRLRRRPERRRQQ